MHITIDSGATVSFIVESEAKRLNLTVGKASQLARQADGDTIMHVLGEVHTTASRGSIKFDIHALVVPKLDDAKFLAGMNFLVENKISQEPYKHRIVVDNKFTIEETPASFTHLPSTPYSKTVNLKKIKAILNDGYFDVDLPPEYPPNSKVIVDASDQANADQVWLFQEVEAVNRNIKIVNSSGSPKVLGKNKDTSVLKIRPVIDSQNNKNPPLTSHFSKDTPDRSDYSKQHMGVASVSSNTTNYKIVESTRNYVARINSSKSSLESEHPLSSLNPEEYLKDIFIEPGVMTPEQSTRLHKILLKHHKVFNEDISEGYNNASGEFDVDWNWLNDQKPPPGVSRQEVYNNEEMNKMKQEKIDWMESQNICFKAHLLGAPIKYASLTMLVPKSSFKKHEGPLHHNLFRFVNLFNQLNEYIALEPSQPESIDSVLYDAGQWEFMISGDLSNSFYQRWICKEKLPYMAFHSPYKGMYVLARSAQGMKNQSEGLDQMMRVILGNLIKEGKARKIADDVQAGGNTVDEAIDNFELVLREFEKNNIKMAPKKTKIFAKRLPIFGFIKEGNMLKPDHHRILAIENSERPTTITELRSYLGQYRVFFKHMKNMSSILEPMERITGEKDGKKAIVWSNELDKCYRDSKQALRHVEPLYLPKRTDKLAITLDWSKSGIGATLFAIMKDRKHVVAYFSATLTGNQPNWPPCDGEGLSACTAIDRFAPYIRESMHPTLICSDSKPVVQAVQLLTKGFFSSSQRLNRLLNNCNTFPIEFHHISGKLSLNEESDMQSRNPSNCTEPNCPVCSFIQTAAETLDEHPTAFRERSKHSLKHILIEDTHINKTACSPNCHTCSFLLSTKPDPAKSLEQNYINSLRKLEIKTEDILNGSKPFPFLGNRKLLIQVQRNDSVLSKLRADLQSGHRPNIRNTKCNDLKTYLGFKPKLEKDGLIVVDRMIQPNLHKIAVPIIPPSFAKSVLLAAHIKLNHPKMSQFEKLVSRSFSTLKTKNMIAELIQNCYTCQADRSFSKEIQSFSTDTIPKHPGSHWCCDILKHGGKNVMVSTDNFSSFTVTKIIPSEKQGDCENAIITSVFPFKTALGETIIRVDTAPGMSAMINNKHLQDGGIKIEPGDAKNKNSCAKVDKMMSELRSILRTISPEGLPLSEIQLQKATESLNMRIRNMNLSAREIMFSRLQNTNENISLDDLKLSETQHENRKKANIVASKGKCLSPKPRHDVKLHSLVFIKNDVSKDKSKLRDLYIVTEFENEEYVFLQKLLHPFTTDKSEINSRHKYRVKLENVYLAPNQNEEPKEVYPTTNATSLSINSSEPAKKTYDDCTEFDSFVWQDIRREGDVTNRFYVLPNDDEPEHFVYIDHSNELSNSKPLCQSSRSKNVLKPKQTTGYRRLRLHTYPAMKKKGKPRILASKVHERWLKFRNRPPDITPVPGPIAYSANEIDAPLNHQAHIDPLPAGAEDFGVIPNPAELTWDHTSDINTPEYPDIISDTEEDLFRIANEVANTALNEEETSEFHHNRLQLMDDQVLPGRVYNLRNRLDAAQSLIQTNEVIIKQKRLNKSAPMTSKTKKKNSKVQWFVKKLTVSRRSPQDDESQPLEDQKSRSKSKRGS